MLAADLHRTFLNYLIAPHSTKVACDVDHDFVFPLLVCWPLYCGLHCLLVDFIAHACQDHLEAFLWIIFSFLPFPGGCLLCLLHGRSKEVFKELAMCPLRLAGELLPPDDESGEVSSVWRHRNLRHPGF